MIIKMIKVYCFTARSLKIFTMFENVNNYNNYHFIVYQIKTKMSFNGRVNPKFTDIMGASSALKIIFTEGL